MAIAPIFADAKNLFPGRHRRGMWGIYIGGARVVAADNVVSFGHKRDWAIADFPIEQGAFANYNKVQTPHISRFRFSAGGNAGNRASFLASIQAISGTLTLFTVVTPEAIYPSVNISHFDYNRTGQSGVGLVSVDVWVQEIRLVGANKLAGAPQNPSNAAQSNGGSVQPTPATPKQTVRLRTMGRGSV